MLRVLVCGSAGRMGRRVVALAGADPMLEVTGAVEQMGHVALGSDAGEIAGMGRIGVPITQDLNAALMNADIAVAFVNVPAASIDQARACAAANKPLVVGTTGLTPDQEARFREAAKPIPVVKATNFSVAVTVLHHLVEEAAKRLGSSFDAEIIEAHHNLKKDAPSGTALSLAEAIAKARGIDLQTNIRHGRKGLAGERPADEIGIHAVRAGDIVGYHTVLFGGTGETLELVHRARSRDTFAVGALRAAKWLVGKPPGYYTMRDVLGME